MSGWRSNLPSDRPPPATMGLLPVVLQPNRGLFKGIRKEVVHVLKVVDSENLTGKFEPRFHADFVSAPLIVAYEAPELRLHFE